MTEGAAHPSARASPGTLTVTDDRVFGPGGEALTRRFAQRVLWFDEVRSLALDPSRASATLTYRLVKGDPTFFMMRIADAVVGGGEELEENALPRWPAGEPVTLRRARDHRRRIERARLTVMAPNLLCVAGAFSFGLTGLAAVFISNFGTSVVYNNAMRSLRTARDPVAEWPGAPIGARAARQELRNGNSFMINGQPDHSDNSTPRGSTDGVGSPAAPNPAAQLMVATLSEVRRPTQARSTIDEHLIRRIEELPREAGWVLVTAGVIGVIAPGIMGIPFLVVGAFILAPGGPRMLSRWAGRKPRKFAHSALRQICRLLDDLDRRYPQRPVVRADAPLVAVEHLRHLDVQ